MLDDADEVVRRRAGDLGHVVVYVVEEWHEHLTDAEDVIVRRLADDCVEVRRGHGEDGGNFLGRRHVVVVVGGGRGLGAMPILYRCRI